MTNTNVTTSNEPQKPVVTSAPAPATPQQQTQANPPKPADKPSQQQK
jgi:hypothetical protein